MFRYENRWRKAVISSVLLHMCLLLLCGLMFEQLLNPQVDAATQVIELDLVAIPAAQAATQAAATTAVPRPPAAIQPLQADTGPQASDTAGLAAMAAPQAAAANPAVGPVGGTTVADGSGAGESAGSSTAAKNGGIDPPSVLTRVTPEYPAYARQVGREGTVLLRVQILENGHAGSISLVRSSGDDSLDDAAITAMRQWRFVPAKRQDNDTAVACFTTIPVTFHLR